MYPRLSRDSFIMWSTIVLVVGLALLQRGQSALLISAPLTLVLLVMAYWGLPRYHAVPFFLLLAPSALVTWLCFEIAIGAVGNGLHMPIAGALLGIGLVSIVIAWQFPRYELVLMPVALGFFVTSIHLTTNLWPQVAVAFVVSLLSIGALAATRRLSPIR